MMLHMDSISCDECGKQSPCIGLGRNDATMACSDCLLKAYQLLNPPTCHTVVNISDIDTTEFKGILHDQRQAHQN